MGSILVVNAGSTSLKLHLVDEREQAARLVSLEEADPAGVDAIAHRVVHGGSRFRAPVLIDTDVREALFELEPLAPLHNAPALAGIERAERLFPTVPHVAVFDTAFHATLPDEAAVYAVPRRWRDEWGVRRYGFHGLSVAWCAERVPELLGRPRRDLVLVVCHLGGGCSVTAVRGGHSVDTTMGFSPQGGVPMTTRPGSVDPGVLLYLLRERMVDLEELEWALNHESGLKALAGTADMREIEIALGVGDADARLAHDVFVHRTAAAVAQMAVAAGGLDALAFTGGIGEGSALVRERVSTRLGFLGVALDVERNADAKADCDVASDRSEVRVVVVQAREELVAARAARTVLGRAPAPRGPCA